MAGYVLLRRAQADLREIRDYILRDNPTRSVSFVEELLVRCQLLADNSRIGRGRSELGHGLLATPSAFHAGSPAA
jgi:plasmid stabilization system protein ParE